MEHCARELQALEKREFYFENFFKSVTSDTSEARQVP